MNYKYLFVKIIFSAILLILLSFNVDFSQIAEKIQNIHPASWAMAAGLLMTQIGALALRWMLLLDAPPSPRPSYFQSLRITFVGFLANYFFITSLGGIVARIALSLGYGFPFIKLLAASLVDRMMTLLALVILSVIFLPFIQTKINFEMNTGFLALLGIGMGALVLIYFYRHTLIFINRHIALGVQYLRKLLTDPLRLTQIIIVSLISQIAYFLAVYAVLYSLAPDFSFLKFMTIMPVITLISSLPIGYGGWGVREGAFVMGFSFLNISADIAFMVSVQMGLLSMALAVATGLPALLSQHTQISIQSWKNKNDRL